MVPGPESNRSFALSTCKKIEHELRFSEGTQVPEPRMVTVMPDFWLSIFIPKLSGCGFSVQGSAQPPAKKTASQIEKETDERRTLNLKFSIENLQSFFARSFLNTIN
jgi:hypothetical protein